MLFVLRNFLVLARRENPLRKEKISIEVSSKNYTPFHSRFSHDVTTAMLVPLNKEKAAMLVPRPNPPGTWLLIT